MRSIAFLACLVLIGCVNSGPRPYEADDEAGPHIEVLDDSTPKGTFIKVQEALLQWDLRTAYFYRSRAIKFVQSFDEFQRDCITAKGEIMRDAGSAKLKYVDVQGTDAIGLVEFPDKRRFMQRFVLEDGIWREDDVKPWGGHIEDFR